MLISKKNLIAIWKPVHNKIFLKTKIKSHGNEVIEIYDKETPKVDSNYTCLAVIKKDFSQETWKLLSSSVSKTV